MHSVLRKLVAFMGLGCLAATAVVPAPEFDVMAGSEEAETGIYSPEARKHEIGTKLKAQAYGGVDFHFDTNIMLRNNNEDSSLVSTGVLGGRLLYEAPRLTAFLLAQANARAFSGFGNLAGVTGHAHGEGEYNISDSTLVNFSDLFEYSQDPVDVVNDVRAERWNNTLSGRFETQGGSWDFTAGVINTILDFNEDRFRIYDYIMLKGFLEGAFDAPFNQEKMGLSETRLWVRLMATNYTHQSAGLNDPLILEGLLGFRGKWQTKFIWDVGFGVGAISVDEKPSNPSDEDKTSYFAFDGTLRYLATERTVVTLSGSRHGEVSQISNYSIVTRASLSALHQFTERLDADAMVGYQYAQFSISDANLVRETARVRVGYQLLPDGGTLAVRLYADYMFTNRDGDQATSEYQDHQVGGGVAAVF